jgi:hypothetical protein
MMTEADCRLHFPDFNRTVDLAGCHELAPAFASIMLDWKHEVQPGLSGDADMRFSRAGKKYDWVITSDGLTAAKLNGKPANESDAASDFHYELYRWYRSAHPQHLCIHAAACWFAAGAVLFPTSFESGKSVLAMALAAGGAKCLGDDVVALDTVNGELVSLGLMPRLRLPLPEKALGAELLQFIKQRQGLIGRQDTYVKLERECFAALGERHKVAGLVILQRAVKYTPARLAQIGPAESLRSLISQNFNTAIDVQAIFNALKAVVMRGRNFKLVYSDLGEAREALKAEFDHAAI